MPVDADADDEEIRLGGSLRSNVELVVPPNVVDLGAVAEDVGSEDLSADFSGVGGGAGVLGGGGAA